MAIFSDIQYRSSEKFRNQVKLDNYGPPRIESSHGQYAGENPMLESMDLSAIVDFDIPDNRKMHDTLL
jgi:hypothetical protein|tara:strand:- start:1142 stop:1345 length:204 start_codon:yes stop_codon:yes gene_type:complete